MTIVTAPCTCATLAPGKAQLWHYYGPAARRENPVTTLFAALADYREQHDGAFPSLVIAAPETVAAVQGCTTVPVRVRGQHEPIPRPGEFYMEVES